MSDIQFTTELGEYIINDSIKFLSGPLGKKLKNKVNLILTSPPFPLNKKKDYGNLHGEAYKKWLVDLAPIFSELLTPDGSIVIELGNAWESGRPIQALLPIESLLEFVKNKKADLRLCQEFICFNPSRLPSPAQWVTVNRIRTVDSYTHVWWMAKTDNPKADNSRILKPYSKRMQQLIKNQKYNSGKRPSAHKIGEKSFLKDNGGSIMHNFLEFEQINPETPLRLPSNVLSFSNTSSNDHFSRACRENGIIPHSARMSPMLATLFIEFLTEEGDLILDPFAGSNTTGYCAEKLGRKWLGIEIDEKYIYQALLRHQNPELNSVIITSNG